GVSEGDRLPASKADMEERLEQVPGVVLARLEAVCCTGDRAVLYVGIEERGAPHFEFRDPPESDAALPQELIEAYNGYLRAFADAARRGEAAESFYEGHPLAQDAAARAYQNRFPALAKANLPALRRVLRESADTFQRAAAAAIIGYLPDKTSVVNDLQYAMQDAGEGVRANAMRALSAMAVLGERDPDSGIKVQPTWFIEMLNSIVWGDRWHSSQALVQITERRDPGTIAELRGRALPALIEMARWKTLAHALPAFLLVGRIAGVPEEQIHDAWKRGDRDAILDRVRR
ncbi:MAG TPA: hypothetical protein VF767_08515, partial [Bryobacteraceae bacterium]